MAVSGPFAASARRVAMDCTSHVDEPDEHDHAAIRSDACGPRRVLRLRYARRNANVVYVYGRTRMGDRRAVAPRQWVGIGLGPTRGRAVCRGLVRRPSADY